MHTYKKGLKAPDYHLLGKKQYHFEKTENSQNICKLVQHSATLSLDQCKSAYILLNLVARSQNVEKSPHSRGLRRRYSRERARTTSLYDSVSRALIWYRFRPCSQPRAAKSAELSPSSATSRGPFSVVPTTNLTRKGFFDFSKTFPESWNLRSCSSYSSYSSF